MSQLKLTADGGGGTVSLKGPSTTTGNAAIELTVPGTGSATVDTLGRSGNILQVKNVTKTDTFSSALSQYNKTSITGMDLAFTASSTSNRLLFQINLNVGISGGNKPVSFYLVADGTKIDAATGDAASNRYRSTAQGLVDYTSTMELLQMNYYHTPTSTSSITYGIKIQNSHDSTNTLYVNRTHNDSDQEFYHRTISSMTIMEVAA